MTLWRFFGLAILLSALLLAVLIGFASTWLRLGLSHYGIEDVAFDSFKIGLDKVDLTGLEVGNPVSQKVDLISVDYSPFMLIGGQVDRVTIAGLRADLDIDEILQGEFTTSQDATPSLLPVGTFVDELIIERGRLNLDTPFGTAIVPFSGHIGTQEDQIDFELTSDGTNREEAKSEIEVTLNLSGTLPLNEPPDLDLATASGEISIQIDEAFLPNLGDSLNGEGLITFGIKDGVFAASTEDLSLAVEQPAMGMEHLYGVLTAGAGDADHPLRIVGQKEGELWHLRINGPLDMTAKLGAGMGDINIHLTLDDEGTLQSLERGIISIEALDLAIDQASLSTAKVDLEIEGEAEALDGHLALALDGFNWSNDRYQLQDLALDQAVIIGFDKEVLTLSIEDQGRASVSQAVAVDHLESGWFTVRFHQNETPFLRFNTKSGTWQHQLHLEIDPVRLETPSGQWWARVEDLDVGAAGDLGGVESGRIAIKRGRADWPGSNLVLAGIESEVDLIVNGALSDRAIPLTINSIRPLEEPRVFTPLRLDAELSPQPNSLAAEGRLTARAKPEIALSFSGTYDQSDDKGVLTFDLPDLRFSETGLQPSDLSPVLQDVVEDTKGRMALTGGMTWEEGELSSSMDLLIEELSLSIGPARLERVNTLFHFDNLTPPTTPVDQELAIALFDVGLPFTDGLVSMQLGNDGELAVDRLSWRLAGGEVKAAPFTFGSDVQDLTMVLDVDQLDLNELLELTRLNGLSGEGRIDGTLPLTINENGVIVADGKLEATDAGILRYRPDETPSALKAGGESIGLMLQALENFHYDDLDISLNGRTDGEADIGLHIRGANPDLYDGHPIEFNLDLEGDLANLVRTNLSNYQIPDRIRERLQGFGR